MCKEAEAEDSGPTPRDQPQGCGRKREPEEKEKRRRRKTETADAGVSKWPLGETKSAEGGEEEITQPVLFSYQLPRQVKRLSNFLLLGLGGNICSGTLEDKNIT